MKKILILITALFFLQSCIEIKETVTVNPDGSGIIELFINLGKVGKTLGQSNQKSLVSVIQQIKNISSSADTLLKNCKGVENIKTLTDESKGIYMVRFDFLNTKALNNALFKLFQQKKTVLSPKIISLTKHQFKQKNIAPLLKKYLIKNESNMLSDAFYQYIKIESEYNFPRPVKKVSNIKALTDNNEKTVRLKYSLSDLLNNDFDYGISVKF